MPRDEGGNWYVERLMDIRRGDLYHKILAAITDTDDLSSLADRVHEMCTQERGEHDEKSLHAALQDFFADKKIAQWFVTRPGRLIMREADLVARDGALFRPDRVVVDEDVVTVIDFKTGDALTSHETQIKKYMEIMKELYVKRRIQGFLFYIDPLRVKEVT
jgi:ATP-dependent exoDNAse (exonuclease V) beta subunit